MKNDNETPLFLLNSFFFCKIDMKNEISIPELCAPQTILCSIPMKIEKLVKSWTLTLKTKKMH